MNNRLRFVSFLLSFFFLLPQVHAQLGKITFDLQKDKPQKFKDKPLRSEKSGDKKLTIPGRFIQNTTSHYNYFFNANNKINSVIEQARMAQKDDYSKLLPYYGYSLDNTAAQKSQLDSVIYKATAGILLHDLRSDWVDNFYLLIGEAYYLRKDFDSAAMTFQFINYNLFPRSKKNDDQLVVGTNDNESNNALSISSKEDDDLVHKVFTRPPSRNDALVWQARTLTDMGDYSEAAGLINTLKNDPLFPGRLDAYFNDVQGYWFYKQGIYDSAIVYLEKAMPAALDLQDKARREYLLAQLYERQGSQDTASSYYDKAIKNTTDPLMDIYANLNEAKMLKSKDPAEIDKGILRLLHMAHKDKFQPYRDIIFYSAGELAMEKPDTSAALSFFKTSTENNQENSSLKNQAFLNLAQLNYDLKNYKQSYNFYDSLQAGDSALDYTAIKARKNALAKIVIILDIIQREDSLQTIAALAPADREAFIKKLSKQLQKERGQKDESNNYGSSAFYNGRNKPDIFSSNQEKGDWYFYNNSLKTQGLSDFKRIWGKRANVDNWRLMSGSTPHTAAEPGAANFGDPLAAEQGEKNVEIPASPQQQDISETGLLANVPLTPAAMDTSESKVARSLFQLGKDYQDLLEDYYAAIRSYEESLKRFPDSLYDGALYSNLFYCYKKIGNIARADYYKNLLLKKFDKSKYAQYVLHPESFDPSNKDTAAAHRYDAIYNLFIEGNFNEAIKEKKAADSMYGKSYWNPQLLYIQSVYYIQKHEDSAAINVLQQIVENYPTNPMKDKAVTMIDVLGRRDSIERYLTNLDVTRAKEDSQIVVFDQSKIVNHVAAPVKGNETPQVKNEVVTPANVTLNPEKKLAPPIKNAEFTFDASEPQNVVMVLTKVDPVYTSEARNAFVRYNNQSYSTNKIEITKDTLDSERTLLLFSSFDNADAAIKYRDKLKQDAPVQISWLPAQKYAFYIISATNLEILKQNKDLESYLNLLNKKYPGKF